MIPMKGANSGTSMHVAEEDDQRAADANAEQRDTDGQTHGEHRAEGDDQDDDAEAETDELSLRLLELGEQVGPQLDA